MSPTLRFILLLIFALLIGVVLSFFIPKDLVYLYGGLVSVYLIDKIL